MGFNYALQLGYQAFINRLLAPAAFGVMAIGWLAMRFGNFFATMGIEKAVIQKRELTDLDIRTAFTVNMVIGALVCLANWFAAPFVAEYFDAPEATGVVRAIGFGVLLTAAGMTSSALLKRRMLFRDLAIREVAAYVVGFPVVGIGLAAAGAGVWSLVGAVLTGITVAVILAYARVRHSLVPALSRASLKELLGFGGRVSVISFLEWLGGNIDTAAVGRYVSSAMLGQYNRAYFLVTYPTNRLGGDISKVLFPGLSRIQADGPRLLRVYINGLTISGFVILPVCAGIAVAHRELVFTVLGPQWDVAADLVPLMALAVAFALMTHLAGVVAEARADLNRKLALQVTVLVLLGALLLLASDYGLWAFAAALATANGVRALLYVGLIHRLLGAPVHVLLAAWLPGLSAAVATAATIGLAGWGLRVAGAPSLTILLGDIAVGGLTLIAVLRWGPVGRVRRELRSRLKAAGILDKKGPVGRIMRWSVVATAGDRSTP